MKRLFLTSVLICAEFLGVAQVTMPFENGWVVDNDGNRIECMIQDKDWLNNPDSFTYRLDGNDEQITATVNDVKEFGTESGIKYVRGNVKVNLNASALGSNSSAPEYVKRTVFLRVLSEGKVNLYLYKPKNSYQNLYISKDGSDIELLVYRQYVEDSKVKVNNSFKKQIFNSLDNDPAYKSRIEALQYSEENLQIFFDGLNGKKSSVVRNQTSFKVAAQLAVGVCPYYNAWDSRRPEIYNYEMGPVFVGGAGAEFSVVLPFNKDRWEILLNPVLYGYRKTQEYYYDNHRSDAVASELYLEIYAALRYGFDLGDKFRVFANAGFAFDVGVKSWMHYYPMGEVGTGNCGIPVFGIGCCYNRKFNAEIRYGSPKDQIDHTKFWYTESPRIELMLGYLFGNK